MRARDSSRPRTVSVSKIPGDTVVPLTPARRSIAEHMLRSRQTSPHAYLMVEVDMSAVSALRERERAEFERRNGVERRVEASRRARAGRRNSDPEGFQRLNL